MLQELVKSLPPLKRQWLRLKMYQLHTPFLAIINPEIVESNDKRVAIKVPLNFITRNSWRTMFFAAISAGVDLTGGWAAFDIAEEFKIGVLYKSMKIDFLRRVDGDLTLICEDNQKITQATEEADELAQPAFYLSAYRAPHNAANPRQQVSDASTRRDDSNSSEQQS